MFSVALIEAGQNVHRTQLGAVLSAPIALFLSMPAGRLVNRFSAVSVLIVEL